MSADVKLQRELDEIALDMHRLWLRVQAIVDRDDPKPRQKPCNRLLIVAPSICARCGLGPCTLPWDAGRVALNKGAR